MCANYSGFNLHQAQQMSFSINVSYSKYFSLKYSNFLSGLFFYRYSKILFNLYQMNWPCAALTDAWAVQSTIQRLFYIIYFFADKLIWSAVHLKHISVVHWLRLHCMTTLLIVGHLLAGHNCARTRCNV